MEYWFELGYVGLFLVSFISATVIPASSEAVFVLMISNGFDPIVSLSLATVGNTLGGMTSYFLGRLGNWKWLSKWFGVKEDKVARFQSRVERTGVYSALLCWAPIVGDVIAVALGFLRVRVIPVMILMTIGKLARYLFLYWMFMS